jgi:hypothetical protein
MAAPPKTKGLLAEDFKEAPGWFAKLLTPLNEFMSSVTNALTGRLTRKDNFLGYTEPFDFTTDASAANTFPLRFKNRLGGGVKPTSVFVGQIYKHNNIKMSAAYSIEWVIGATGEIEVTFTGLENSTRYVGTLVFDA